MLASYRIQDGFTTYKKPQRSLYIDLIGEGSEVIARLEALSQQLGHAQRNPNVVAMSSTPFPFKLSEDRTREDRVRELAGEVVPYQMSQLAPGVSGEEQIAVVEGLCAYFPEMLRLDATARTIEVVGVTHLRYGVDGKIIDGGDTPGIDGAEILPALAAFIDQDFGVVLRRGNSLVYIYESSEFEKTPKRVEGGENSFLGNDFLEWHRRIPTYGAHLSAIFEKAADLFSRDTFDMLVVDLRGRNLYTDGQRVVRRFERDYLVPLNSASGKPVGMCAFADLLIGDINTLRNPLSGGSYLIIESPILFNRSFRVVKHDAFREHPRGMRTLEGKAAATW